MSQCVPWASATKGALTRHRYLPGCNRPANFASISLPALADGSISLSLSATPLRGRVVPSTKPELSRPKPRESPLSNTQKAPPPPPRLSRGAFSRCLQQGGRCGDDHPGLLLPPVQPPRGGCGGGMRALSPGRRWYSWSSINRVTSPACTRQTFSLSLTMERSVEPWKGDRYIS